MASPREMVVSMRQFTDHGRNGALLLRIGRDGLTEIQESYLDSVLADIPGVQEVTTSWRYIQIEKDDDADWLKIRPAIREVLAKMLGRKTRFIERTEGAMPEGIERILRQADHDTMESVYEECYLTDQEADAIGVTRR